MKIEDQLAERIFVKTLAIADPAGRRVYIRQTCSRRLGLAREIESLLSAHEQAGEFLENLPPAVSEPPVSTVSRGRLVGDYELLEEVARGGMGVVYRARQISLNRVVALKMILAGEFASQKAMDRFRAEAAALAMLNHPNIVSIYEMGEHGGCLYYSMRFVQGQSLAQLVGSGQWKLGEGTKAAKLLAKIARAMHHAHQHEVLHRDLKPGNILIDTEGEPHVTDFGLAKSLRGGSEITIRGELLGTPSFMPPEQAEGGGKESAATADIYGLGTVLYYLLTGRPPFLADLPLDALWLVLHGEPALPRSLNPRIPADLERICLRCLAKDPKNRYPSANQLAEDLERFLRRETLSFPPPDLSHRIASWFKRQPALASRLTGLAVCATISQAAALGGLLGERQAQHPKIMVVLGLWAVVSWLCQWGLRSERWANAVRYIWAGADATMLTLILFLDRALETPLMALYPAWVAGSGLWLRVPLVVVTALMAGLGYGLLLLDTWWHGPRLVWPAHWHIIGLFMLSLTGFAVAYLVFRLRALSRFYERGVN